MTTWSTCKKQLLESAASFVSLQTDGSIGGWEIPRQDTVCTYEADIPRSHVSYTHRSTHKGTRAKRPNTQHWGYLSPINRGRTAPKPCRKIHWHTKIRQKYRISAAQIHGKVHETGAVRSGTWRGRGAAHAPASILVRPPRGYHCNMAATHFLAEVLRWFLLLISTTAFFVTVPNSCGFTALILIHILMENRER